MKKKMILIIVLLLAVVIGSGCFYTVEENEYT